MSKKHTVVIALCLIVLGWVVLFPTTQMASSSPMLGYTETPTDTDVPTPTETPHVPQITPTNTPEIPTFPPPPTQTGILIPVTGANHSTAAGGGLLVTTGLVVLAIGMVCLGLSMRKK